MLAVSPILAGEAAAAPIIADRPSISTGPEVLDAGIFQLEAGSRFSGGSLASAGFEVTQRFGLIPGLEFRVGTPLIVASGATSSSVSLGAKAQFLEGYLLSLGALGSVELSPQGTSPQAAFLATLGLPAGYALTVNAGPAWSASGLEWTGAALLAYDSGNLWQAFGEVARYQDLAGTGTGWGADAGLEVLVTEDLIWDVAVLRGLSPEVPVWAVTSGFALRWGR
jgi:hypothetical protein